MTSDEQRARDALAFDPLPPSRWVTTNDHGVIVKVRYSEPLSRLLRSISRAKWEPEHKQWQYPFAAADAIRRALPDINRLAELAMDRSEKETQLREARRARFETAKAEAAMERDIKRAMAQPRPLRQEYLEAIPDRPRFALTLEAIGDNLCKHGFSPRCWVARIFGSNGRGSWARVFISGARDYANANSNGSRGITVTYFLEEGLIYEISDPKSWKSTERLFVRIDNSEMHRLSTRDVEQCLTPLRI